jgi:hypothetical protein
MPFGVFSQLVDQRNDPVGQNLTTLGLLAHFDVQPPQIQLEFRNPSSKPRFD